MLYYSRIEVFEGNDVNKTIKSKECIIFLDKGFKFQPSVCNRRHDVVMMLMNLRNCYFKYLWCYCCIIFGISKCEAINLLKNADLNEKSGPLKNI